MDEGFVRQRFCITPDLNHPCYGDIYSLPIPFAIDPPGDWVKAPETSHGSLWTYTDSIQDATQHCRNIRPGEAPEPPAIVHTKIRPVILFTGDCYLQKPEVQRYLVLPMYTYKGELGWQEFKAQTIAGEIPHTLHIQEHLRRNCIDEGFIDFTRLQVVHKKWFSPEFSQTVVMRNKTNPICRMSAEAMDHILGWYGAFLKRYTE